LGVKIHAWGRNMAIGRGMGLFFCGIQGRFSKTVFKELWE
jgi:hypothetical protein